MSALSENPPFGSCDFSLDAQPPKKPHMLLDHVPDSQAKGSWKCLCAWAWILGSVSPSHKDCGWVHERVREDVPGHSIQTLLLQETSCYFFHQFFGKVVQHCTSSTHPIVTFCALYSFFYCTTSVPTDTQLVHHFIMEQFHQNAVARIPFFPPQLYTVL